MDSRMERYEDVDIKDYQRSKKNADLYKEIYGNYVDFEDLPIPENTNEIDIDNIKSLVGSRINRKKERVEENNINIDNKNDTEDEKNEVEEKVYDINELLEKAKLENAKIKKEEPVVKNAPNYLTSLESDKSTRELILKNEKDEIREDLQLIKTLEYNSDIINISTDSLSLDILSDLKPGDDSFVDESMKEELEKAEKEFYSGKLKFSENDFNVQDEVDNDEIFKEEKKYLFFKLLFIVVGVSCLLTAIYCGLKEFGIIKF